jgi:membrane protein YdbS with pleckstrin-like domain
METLARLKTMRLFASLSPASLERVAQVTTRHSYPKGSILCREDEFGETLYIIDSGEVLLRQIDLRGVEKPVGYLREGASIGEDALLLGNAFGRCMQATTDVEALRIRKQDFDRLLQQFPQMRTRLRASRVTQERLNVPTVTWLAEDEKPVLLRKRHWIVFVRNLPLPVLMLLGLALVVRLVRPSHVGLGLLLALLFAGLVPLLLFVWYYVDWQNDYYLLTTDRVIRREKIVLITESSDEAPLSKIQDTRIVYNLIGNMLGYGSLRIDTASARGTIDLDHLPDPRGMEGVISEQVRYLKWQQRQEERESIRGELLRQTGQAPAEEPPLIPEHPTQQKVGILARLQPSRPLLAARYQQADKIVWRKHWLFLFKRVWLAFPIALASLLLIGISLYTWPTQYSFPLLLISLVAWIPSFLWLLWEWEDWRNDEYILTDRAVTDVEKKPLFFAEERKQATLDMIQNVSLNIPGPLAAIFNFGDVLIQTAGPGGTISFLAVPHPAEVQREVFRRIEAFIERQRRRERDQRKAEFATWFQVYDEINRPQTPPSST